MGKGFSKGLGLVVANNPVRETLKHKAIVYMLVRYFWRRNQHSLPIFVPISTISKCTTIYFRWVCHGDPGAAPCNWANHSCDGSLLNISPIQIEKGVSRKMLTMEPVGFLIRIPQHRVHNGLELPLKSGCEVSTLDFDPEASFSWLDC